MLARASATSSAAIGWISTRILEHNAKEQWAVIHATIEIPNGGSATGMVIQSPTGIAKDYIANGETSAIGRALAALGFGTQHATEFDQGDQVVDSPVNRQQAARPSEAVAAKPTKEFDAQMGNPDEFVRRAFESLWAYLSPDA